MLISKDFPVFCLEITVEFPFISTIDILHQPGVKLSKFWEVFLTFWERREKLRLEQRTQAKTQVKLSSCPARPVSQS